MTNPIELAQEIISLLDNSGATIEEKEIALNIAKALYKYVPKSKEDFTYDLSLSV